MLLFSNQANLCRWYFEWRPSVQLSWGRFARHTGDDENVRTLVWIVFLDAKAIKFKGWAVVQQIFDEFLYVFLLSIRFRSHNFFIIVAVNVHFHFLKFLSFSRWKNEMSTTTSYWNFDKKKFSQKQKQLETQSKTRRVKFLWLSLFFPYLRLSL